MSFGRFVQEFLLLQKYQAVEFLGRKLCISSILFNMPNCSQRGGSHIQYISTVREFLMLHAIKDKRLQAGWIFPAPSLGQEIQSRRKFKVLNSMAFNVVTELCTHQHNQL